MTKLRRARDNTRITCGGICNDCGMETVPRGKRKPRTHEQFIVKNEVWAAAGMPLGKIRPKTFEIVGGGGFLCVGCIEKRLGRRLTINDFNPITIPQLLESPWITERLRSRVLYPDQASENAAKLAPDRLSQTEMVLTEDGLVWNLDFDDGTYTAIPDRDGQCFNPEPRSVEELLALLEAH